MTASIPVEADTKERLERLKREDETWSEFLDRLAAAVEATDDSPWKGTRKAELARDAVKRSRESFE